MANTYSHYITSKPISLKGRWILTGCMLLVATILGFAASVALYQVNRDVLRQSDVIGYVLCGPGQHIDDVPAGGRGRRMICRDAADVDVSARNNLIAVNMGLPLIVIFAVPGLLLAWRVDWREARR